MGVDTQTLVALGGFSKAGFLQGDLLTFGRHNTFFKPRDLRKISYEFGLNLSDEACEELASERFTEALFSALGVATCTSVDASGYEGASIVHDLNLPFGPGLADKFDFIFDGGTTEHVYNIAEVQKNIATALKVGGYYFATCPANNDPGHGFYQFTPEFYFRSLQKAGFEIVRLYLVAWNIEPAQWYVVQDPREIGGRVQYLSAELVYNFVLARKIQNEAFAEAPEQSDYESGNWVTQKDHLEDVQKATVMDRANRKFAQRISYPINLLARNFLRTGSAVWPTTDGIQRVNIFDDLKRLARACALVVFSIEIEFVQSTENWVGFIADQLDFI